MNFSGDVLMTGKLESKAYTTQTRPTKLVYSRFEPKIVAERANSHAWRPLWQFDARKGLESGEGRFGIGFANVLDCRFFFGF
jgi:hypothetical protein